MKVLILTYGSRGDVQPYLALGLGLAEAGHEVTLATSKRFRDFVESRGLRFGPLSDELLSLIDTDLGREIMENTTTILGAGSAPIPQKRLTGSNLAAAIRQVTSDRRIIDSATALGEKIRAEDGVANAIAFIESVVAATA